MSFFICLIAKTLVLYTNILSKNSERFHQKKGFCTMNLNIAIDVDLLFNSDLVLEYSKYSKFNIRNSNISLTKNSNFKILEILMHTPYNIDITFISTNSKIGANRVLKSLQKYNISTSKLIISTKENCKKYLEAFDVDIFIGSDIFGESITLNYIFLNLKNEIYDVINLLIDENSSNIKNNLNKIDKLKLFIKILRSSKILKSNIGLITNSKKSSIIDINYDELFYMDKESTKTIIKLYKANITSI